MSRMSRIAALVAPLSWRGRAKALAADPPPSANASCVTGSAPEVGSVELGLIAGEFRATRALVEIADGRQMLFTLPADAVLLDNLTALILLNCSIAKVGAALAAGEACTPGFTSTTSSR